METNNKQDYREFCKNEKSIPVFSKDWWLDAEYGINNWDVALVNEDNNIIATMPFALPVGFFKKSTMPQFAQTLGPWYNFDVINRAKYKLNKEFELQSKLIAQLPKTKYFIQQFHWSIKNYLPFYWCGFRQDTKYTHIINDISNVDNVIENFHTSKKRNLKKARKSVKVTLDYPAKDFYKDYAKFLIEVNSKIQYSEERFLRIYEASIQNSSGQIFCAKDDQGNVHSALFVVWDANSAYHLITPINPNQRRSNSLTLLIVEAISFLKDKTLRYNFEGSMIQNIEKSFREYGGDLVPYHRIKKIESSLLKILFFIKGRL